MSPTIRPLLQRGRKQMSAPPAPFPALRDPQRQQFTAIDDRDMMHPSFRFFDVARAAGHAPGERIDDASEWGRRYPERPPMAGPVLVELMVDSEPGKTREGVEQAELPRTTTPAWATRPWRCRTG